MATSLCGPCTPDKAFPPSPFPDPPVASAYLVGHMIEVGVADAASNAQVLGQMIEVSTQQAANAEIVGQMMEVAVKV